MVSLDERTEYPMDPEDFIDYDAFLNNLYYIIYGETLKEYPKVNFKDNYNFKVNVFMVKMDRYIREVQIDGVN